MSKCCVCKNEFNWKEMVEEFEDLFACVDVYGMSCLTEQEQVVVDLGECCSRECFEKLQ